MNLLALLLLLTTEPTSLMVIARDLATMQQEGGRLHEATIHEAPGNELYQIVQLQWTIPAFSDSLELHVYMRDAWTDSMKIRNRGVYDTGEILWSEWGVYKEDE